MNKSRSQFDSLSREDQKHILDLCARQTYDDIVDQLRKPRAEGGLDIATSRAALCRYFTTSHQDSELAVLGQYAAAASIRHEQNSNAFLGAIRANVEARVLESLRKGKALADMDKDFRLLKTVENLYLADAHWRASDPKGARANYQRHVDRCAEAPDFDFIPVQDLENDPQGSNLMHSLSEFDLDVFGAQERRDRELDAFAQKITSLQPADPSQQGALGLPDALKPVKTPVIPHIPPNSSKHVPPAHNPPAQHQPAPHHNSQPCVTEPKKPVPYVSPVPKVGRNDPSPAAAGANPRSAATIELGLPAQSTYLYAAADFGAPLSPSPLGGERVGVRGRPLAH